jgi:hypothetical protein
VLLIGVLFGSVAFTVTSLFDQCIALAVTPFPLTPP